MNADQLRDLIRSEAEARPSADFHVIAAGALTRIPDDELRSTLACVLPRVVGDMLRQEKNRTLGSPAEAPFEERPTAPATPIKQGRSRRSIAHAAWKAKLEVRVGVANNVTKRLGDLTLVDVEFQLAKLAAQRTALDQRADWWKNIHAAMAAAGAATIDAVPEAALVPLLEAAAA